MILIRDVQLCRQAPRLLYKAAKGKYRNLKLIKRDYYGFVYASPVAQLEVKSGDSRMLKIVQRKTERASEQDSCWLIDGNDITVCQPSDPNMNDI